MRTKTKRYKERSDLNNFKQEIKQHRNSFERKFVFIQMSCRIFWFCKMAHHVSFEAIETYLQKKPLPSHILGDKGKKANFRKPCKLFSTLHGQLMYNKTRLFISITELQHTIISDVHKGLGHDPKAKPMTSHCGRNSDIQKISNRLFWHNIKGDVEEFTKKCDQYQKQGKI